MKYHIGWIESRTPDWKVWIKENQYWIYDLWKHLKEKNIWDVVWAMSVTAILVIIAYGEIVISYNQAIALEMELQYKEFQNFTHYME